MSFGGVCVGAGTSVRGGDVCPGDGTGSFGCVNDAPPPRPAQPRWRFALGVLGLAAHVVVGYLYLTAGLVTPLPWLVAFLIAWLVLLVAALVLLRRHPLWVLLVPVLALGLLVGGLSLGGALLGWRA